MTTIDERIVAMRFNNDQFEKGVRRSMKTLEDLREASNLDDVASNMGRVAKSVNKNLDFEDTTKSASIFSKALNGLGSVAKKTFNAATFPLQALGKGFQTLGKYTSTVLGFDLASKLVNAGETVVRAFTIDPVKSGLSEYELKMDSIKTIMTGTKSTYEAMMKQKNPNFMYDEQMHLDYVKQGLEELNRYADDTIYSFQDMTNSIGKFTNAGVEFETAIDAIKGISNATAHAGQDAQAASSAMYNLSQAFGLGYLGYRDFYSLQNARIATLAFKETFIEMGVALKKLKKDEKTGKIFTLNDLGQIDEKSVEVNVENFQDTLNKRWADKNVMLAALGVYSGEYDEARLRELYNLKDKEAKALAELGKEASEAATQVRTFTKMWDALKEAVQSGWATTWELIIGDLDEAAAFWTSLNDRFSALIKAQADSRNALFQGWRGRKKNEKTGEWEDVEGAVDGRKVLIDALNDLLDTIQTVSGAIGKAWKNVFGVFTSEKLLNITTNFRNFVKSIKDWFGSSEINSSNISKITNVFEGFFSILDIGKTAIEEFGKRIFSVIKKIAPSTDTIFAKLLPISDWLKKVAAQFKKDRSFKNLFKNISDAISKEINALKKGILKQYKVLSLIYEKEGLKGVFSRVINKAKSYFSGLFKDLGIDTTPIINIFNQVRSIFDSIQKEFENLSKIYDEQGIGGVISRIGVLLKGSLEGLGIDTTPITNLFTSVKTSFEQLKTDFETLPTIIEEEGIGGVIELIKKYFNKAFENLGIDTKPISDLFSNFKGKFEELTGIDLKPFEEWIQRFREAIFNIGKKNGEANEELTEASSFADILNKASSIFQNIKDSITNFIEFIKTADWDTLTGHFVSTINELSSSFLMIGAGAGAVGVSRLLNSAAGVGKSLSQVVKGAANAEVSLGDLEIETHSGVQGVVDSIQGHFEELTPKLDGAAKVILEFSASMYLLANALKTIDEIEDPLGDTGIVVVLTGIMAAFDGITKLTTSKIGSFRGASLTGLIGYIMSMHELANDITKFGELDKGQLDNATAVIAKLTLFIAAFDTVGKLTVAGLGARKGASLTGMIGYVLAMHELVNDVVKLGELNKGQLDNATAVIAKLTLLVEAFDVVNKMSSYAFGSTNLASIGAVAGFAGSLNTLINSVVSIKDVPRDQVDQAIEVIAKLTALVTAFDLVSKLSSYGFGVQSGTSFVTLTSFTIAIRGLTDSAVKLASVDDVKKLDKASQVIAKLAIFIEAYEVIGKLTTSAIGASGFKSTGLIGFTVAITGMTNSVTKLADAGSDNLQAAVLVVAELTGLIAGFQTLFTLIQSGFTATAGKQLGGSVSSILLMLGLISSLTIMVSSVQKLSEIDKETLDISVGAVKSLLEVVAAVAFGMTAIDSKGLNIAGAGKIALIMVGVIAALMAIVYAFDSYSKYIDPEFIDKIKNTGQMLFELGGLLGKLIAGVINPIASIFVPNKTDLTDVMPNIAELGTPIEKLSQISSRIDVNGLENLFLAFEKLKDIAAMKVNDVAWYSAFFANEKTIFDIAEKLPKFGNNISAFYQQVSSVDNFGNLVAASEFLRNISEALNKFDPNNTWRFYNFLALLSEGSGKEINWGKISESAKELSESFNTGILEASEEIDANPLIDAIIKQIQDRSSDIQEAYSQVLAGSKEKKDEPSVNTAEEKTEVSEEETISQLQQLAEQYGISLPGLSFNEEETLNNLNELFGSMGGEAKQLAADLLAGIGIEFGDGVIKAGRSNTASSSTTTVINGSDADNTPWLDMAKLNLQSTTFNIKGIVSLNTDNLTKIETAIKDNARTIATSVTRVESQISDTKREIYQIRYILQNGSLINAFAGALDVALGNAAVLFARTGT